MMHSRRPRAMITMHQQGFTLVEMIIAIVLTGIVVGMVSMFIRTPIQNYFDVAHRAEITDAADTAVRRISRDLRVALPNSLRQPGSQCLEFMPTRTGGRYRADLPGTPLDFSTAVTTFEYVGAMSSTPVVGDLLVIYNLGITGADVYNNDNVATVTSVTAGSLNFTSKQFPFRSPGSRFQIVPVDDKVVSYVCAIPSPAINPATGDGNGILYRYANYVASPAAGAACPSVPANTPILARNVSSCNFSYASGITQRSGLAALRLAITKGNETATLHHEVHVNNAP